MIPTPPRALVFMNARNCAKYVGAALESLAWQTHPSIHVLFVDDCSSDETGTVAQKVLSEFFDGRHTFVRNPEQWGKARNTHVHLRACRDKGDFVAVFDADDQLIKADILAEMAAQYDAGFDVVWSNFETDQGAVGRNAALDPFVSPRKQGWKTSHFFSFRAELLDGVPESYFRDDTGAWLTAACDLAIAFPMLDQTRRYRFLPVVAYRYTATNPSSHHNQDPHAVGLSSRHQMRSAEVVLAKAPLPCRRWVFGPQGAGDQLIGQLQHKVLAGQQALMQRLAGGEPARSESAPGAQDPWIHAAANLLHQRCPGLLELVMASVHARPDVEVLWAWWQWLQRGPAQPRVLSIGTSPLSAALHALTGGLGGKMTHVCGDQQRAMSLYASLGSASIDAEVLHVPLVAADFEGHAGEFPNLALLPDDAIDFDLVIVHAEGAGRVPADAVLSLPMVLPRLRAEGFRLCVWSPGQPQPLQQAVHAWRAAAPELGYAEGALAGQALVVHSH